MSQKRFLKISELAQLAKINTRTLHYYDEIGLFSPERKDEYGQRYYAMKQLIDLGIILSLKELDMTLKEIKNVVHGNVEDSKPIVVEKLGDVREKIEQLKEIEQMLTSRLENISVAEQGSDSIQLKELEEERLFLSQPIKSANLDAHIKAGYQLIKEKGKYVFTNNEYGVMISCEKKIGNVWDEMYDYFYLKSNSGGKDTFVKTAGTYATYIHKGGERELPLAYEKMIQECEKKAFKLEGYFYERALYETIKQNEQEYVTEIQVKVSG